jgi:hypothetical protein
MDLARELWMMVALPKVILLVQLMDPYSHQWIRYLLSTRKDCLMVVLREQVKELESESM